jgi:demethylmenaquinone methyltransferase / 2-methoxy-6-polyprenyl-1,4-benzoquinol methylase
MWLCPESLFTTLESGRISLPFTPMKAFCYEPLQNMIDKQRPDWNESIQGMFSRISKRYDLLNTLMSFGRDRLWRKLALHHAGIPSKGSLLDLGTGTGKIALDAKKKNRGLTVAALDLTTDMMKVGRAQASKRDILWINGDALNLPFGDECFDVVISGYLMRNVPDVDKAFREQLRIVKRGGRVVCLDTCPAGPHALKPLVDLYLKIVIPLLGGLVSGQWDAYRYLPESIRSFNTPHELARIMEASGFTNVAFHTFMLDTVAILIGERSG